MSVPVVSYVFGEPLWARSTVSAMSVDETTIYLPVKPPYRGWGVVATINLTAVLPWIRMTSYPREYGFASTRVVGWEFVRLDGSHGTNETAVNVRENVIRATNCVAVTFRLGASIAEAAAAALVFLTDAAASAPADPPLPNLPKRKRLTVAVGLRSDRLPLLTRRFVALDNAELPSVPAATRAALASAEQLWRVPRRSLTALVVPGTRRTGPFAVDWGRKRVVRVTGSLTGSEPVRPPSWQSPPDAARPDPDAPRV